MAEKGFGVKEVNLIGASGTPTITSPNNLNLNANNVAISTNVSIGGTLSVTGNVSVGGTLTYEDVTNIDSVGVVTARSGLSVTGGTSFFAGAISAAGGITGTATTATNITVTANNTANETVYPLFSDGASGSQGAETDTNLTYNPSTNLFTAGSFSGSGANLTSLAANQLSSGTIPDARFPSTLPAASGANLTNLNGSNIASGTVADARISTLTASKLSGALPAISGANLTNLPEPDEAPVVDFTVTANGSSAYRFSGGGVDSSADDPDLYLIRGQKYRFNNTTGSAHPFQFRATTGGSAYTAGVSGDQNGVQFFTPNNDAPSKIYYICTLHSNMVGTIYIREAGGNNENVGVTTFSGSVTVGYDTTYSPIQQAASTYFYTRADQASSVSGSNIQNLATGSLKISETIPISNMTRQSDAGAHSFYNSSSTSGSVTTNMTAGNPFAPKSYGLTMGTMFYSHTSGNNGSGVIHYGWTPTNHHFFVRYKYNSNSILVGADTDGSDNWSTAYQNDLMSDSNWYFLVVAVERNGTLLTSLNGAPLTPIRIIGTAPEPGNARFGLAGDAYGDNNSRHRYATAFWHRGVISNELIAQEYAWLKTIWTGASLP